MRFKKIFLTLSAILAGSVLLTTSANAGNTASSSTASSTTTTVSKTTVVYVRTLVNGEYKNIPIQVPTAWIKNLPTGTHNVNGKIVTIKATGAKFVPSPEIGSTIVYSNHKNLAIGFGVELEYGFLKEPGSNVKFMNLDNQAFLGVTYLVNQKYDVQLFAVSNPGQDGFKGLTTGDLYAGVSTGSYGTVSFGAQDTSGDYAGLLANLTQELGGINQLNPASTAAILYQSPILHGFQVLASYNIGTGAATTTSMQKGSNANGFSTYLKDTIIFNKKLAIVNQLAYGRLYNTSNPISTTGGSNKPGTQQAWDIGTNWYIGHGIGSGVLGVNISKSTASQGTGVNENYQDTTQSNIDNKGEAGSISAFQIAGGVQYSKTGGMIYANYIGAEAKPAAGNNLGFGKERTHGAVLGINYVFNLPSPNMLLEVYTEGSVFKSVNLKQGAQFNRSFVSGIIWVF